MRGESDIFAGVVRGERMRDADRPTPNLTCVEVCAGGGGQAIGLEMAGF